MVEYRQKTAGIMGGMGPDATVDFMSKVIALSDSGRDQDHVHLIVDQDPTVPNRQVAINSGKDNVSEHITMMAKRLEAAGADFLVMVCNTAHVFIDDMHANIGIPFINIIDESVREIDRVCSDAKIVGVMATDGCLNTHIFQDAIETSGRIAIVPDAPLLKVLMDLINAIKSGDQGDNVKQGMGNVAQHLVDKGADVVISGCTEIPIVFDGAGFTVPVIASTNVLAERTVSLAKGVEPLPPTSICS